MQEPFFSIVIPVFNREKFIGNTVSTVLTQTFRRFEIVIVDDGSTDGSASIIKNLNSDKIKYHYIQNSERGAARNYGFNQSLGEYVIFFDSDDLMDENHLQSLYDFLTSNEVNFVATKFVWEDEAGLIKFNDHLRKLKEGFYNYSEFIKGNFLGCNVCVKKENPNLILFQEDRSLSIMEDWIFFMENLINDRIYMLDTHTIKIKEHALRSMNENHGLVIERKLNALSWLQNSLSLEQQEFQKMWSFGYYFIATHYYLEGDLKKGLSYLLKSFFKGHRIVQVLLLGIKLIVGKQNIQSLTSH